MSHFSIVELAVEVTAQIPATGVLTLVAGAVLVLMFVALGSFAYESLTGDGITWPDERDDGTADGETVDDDSVERGRTDDEWEYY